MNVILAGGAAIGSASDLVVTAGIAMLIGMCAGIVSAFGFIRINKFLQDKAGLHDTCGVHNLHGLPGVMGGIIGAISASFADASFDDAAAIGDTFPAIKEDGRTASEQGWYQLATLGITLVISIAGGAFSGLVASCFCPPEELFDDTEHFRECEPPDMDEDHRATELATNTERDLKTKENAIQ